jgi:hypothetical protein
VSELLNREPESNPDLVDYTSTQLLDELLSRFDHAVFCGKSNRAESLDAFHRRFCGSSLVCSSLASHMQSVTMGVFNDECEEAQE